MDLCGFLNGTDKNIATKWLIGQFTKSLPKGSFHGCPYKSVKFYNMTTDVNSMMSAFTHGTYRATVRMYDNEDENIITMFYGVDYM